MHLYSDSGTRMVARLCLLLFLGPLVFFATCSPSADPLPHSLGAMRLEKIQAGAEARREIDRLHGKQIEFQRGYIGTYAADNGSGQIWVSVHGSDSEAAEAIEKMASSMRRGKQESFYHFRKITIEQWPVYLAVGMGKVHYFFQKGAKVVWLAVDPPLAKEAIRDALGQI